MSEPLRIVPVSEPRPRPETLAERPPVRSPRQADRVDGWTVRDEAVESMREGWAVLRSSAILRADAFPMGALAFTPPVERASDPSVLSPPPNDSGGPIGQVPSDDALQAWARSEDAIDVPGLGPLPADEDGLRSRLARVVRAQGVSTVEHHLARLRADATALLNASNGSSRTSARAKALLARAETLQAGLPELLAERAAVKTALEPAAVAEGQAILAATRERVATMRAQYFSESRGVRADALASLRADAQALLDARQETQALRGRSAADRVLAAEARYASVLAVVSDRHPLLATFDLNTPEYLKLCDLANDTEQVTYGPQLTERARRLDEPARGILDGIDSAAAEMQEELRNDPSTVWRLPGMVEAALLRHGIAGHGMVAGHARDLCREASKSDAAWRTLVSVLAVGLGIAAALPSGGTSVAVAATLATGLDAYQLYLSVEDYRFQSAASGMALDRRDAFLSEAPTPFGLILDGLAAVAGAAGTVTALRKTFFQRLLSRQGPVGEMARGLEPRLGRERASSLVSVFGDGEAARVYHNVRSEVWSAISDADEVAIVAAAQSLGPDRFIAWAERLDPKHLGALVERVPVGAWSHLVVADVDPAALARAVDRFEPELVAGLAPSLKGRGLVTLSERIPTGSVAMTQDGFLRIDGQLRVHPQEILRGAEGSGFGALQKRWEEVRARSPEAARLGQVTGQDVAALEGLRDLAKNGRPLDPNTVGRLSKRTGAPPPVIERVARELAGVAVKLSPRAERLALAAPELRGGLEALSSSPRLSPALVDRALKNVEAALASKSVTFDREHLGQLLVRGVHDVDIADRRLAASLDELECGLSVVREGRVAEGSTLYLGLQPGKRVRLSPDGPWVEMAKPMAGHKGGQQEMDVLFLTPEGVVQQVEVKQSAEALWHAIDRAEGGLYLQRMTKWRREGTAVGQERAIAISVASDTGALQRVVPGADGRTPSELLEDAKIDLWVRRGDAEQ